MPEAEKVEIEELSTEITPSPKPLTFVKREPKKDLSRAKILIFGPPKIGKSTLASQFPGVLFLATEEGLDWLSTYSISVPDWQDTELFADDDGHITGSFLHVLAWLEAERPKVLPGTKQPLHFIAVDTVDFAYQMCLSTTCRDVGIQSPADLEWGKGWKLVGDEWIRVLSKFSRLGYGLVFVSHDKVVERKSKARKIDVISPSVQGSGAKAVLALVDIILYAYMTEEPIVDEETGELSGEITEQRVIRCHPQNNVVAGDRTGCLPPEIPLSYEALLEHFPDTPKVKK